MKKAGKKVFKAQIEKLDAAALVRDRAMNQLAAVLTAIYGERCDRKQAACAGCVAWTIFDAMEQITDIGYFQDMGVEEAMRIIERGKRNEQ